MIHDIWGTRISLSRYRSNEPEHMNQNMKMYSMIKWLLAHEWDMWIACFAWTWSTWIEMNDNMNCMNGYMWTACNVNCLCVALWAYVVILFYSQGPDPVYICFSLAVVSGITQVTGSLAGSPNPRPLHEEAYRHFHVHVYMYLYFP